MTRKFKGIVIVLSRIFVLSEALEFRAIQRFCDKAENFEYLCQIRCSSPRLLRYLPTNPEKAGFGSLIDGQDLAKLDRAVNLLAKMVIANAASAIQ